jgi:hypothetical protein
MLVSSPRTLASPERSAGRRVANPQQLFQLGDGYRGCSHSLMFRPASLLVPPIAPTLAPRQSFPIDAGRPGLLRPRISRLVTCPVQRISLAVQSRAIDGNVGIEVWRARPLRVRWLIHRFPNGPQSGSRHAHVSTSPPCHPGRSDFPSPVGDHDFHCSLPSPA